MLIKCPFCGDREATEFAFGRAAEGIIDPLNPSIAQTALYERENARGRSLELWQHIAGCRAWLRVERNVLTHEITATSSASIEK